MNFAQLPTDIKSQVKSNLSCYDKCTIEKTSSGYDVYNGVCLHNGKYGEILEVRKQEIYSYAEWCAAFEASNGYKPSPTIYPAWN